MMEFKRESFLISTDKNALQHEVIIDYLQNESYWARGRLGNLIEKTLERSLCFGLYESGKQIGFARVVTDCTIFAYLCDVFVLPAWQGQGLGKWLIECVVSYLDEQGVQWTMLASYDAQELYESYGGFQKLHLPEKWMGRVNPSFLKPAPDPDTE